MSESPDQTQPLTSYAAQSIASAPAPSTAPVGWRATVLGLRGVVAVALASLIIGGTGGVVLGKIGNDQDTSGFGGGGTGFGGGGFPRGGFGGPGQQGGVAPGGAVPGGTAPGGTVPGGVAPGTVTP